MDDRLDKLDAAWSAPEWPRHVWESVQEALFFLPPYPEQLDTLALFGLLLIGGLLIGEWGSRRFHMPKVVGYVVAGSVFGPSMLGWISLESLAQIRMFADAALGLLLMEFGRRIDLRWLCSNPRLWRGGILDISFTFFAIMFYAAVLADLSPAWAAATAAITMASAPGVVLLTIEDQRAVGQITERIVLHTAIGSAASFVMFAVVLGVVHAQQSQNWLNAVAHPVWVIVGSGLIAGLLSRLALRIAARVPKGSLSQVFVLVACAMLAIGFSRMAGCPVFLTLFALGLFLARFDTHNTLRYTDLPEAHWLLAIVLFVVTGASLPWSDMTVQVWMQAVGLLLVRAVARWAAVQCSGNGLGVRANGLIVLGTQPLSATAIFMAYEIAALYPEIGRSALTLPLFAAALMELIGPVLCRYALVAAGETAPRPTGAAL